MFPAGRGLHVRTTPMPAGVPTPHPPTVRPSLGGAPSQTSEQHGDASSTGSRGVLELDPGAEHNAALLRLSVEGKLAPSGASEGHKDGQRGRLSEDQPAPPAAQLQRRRLRHLPEFFRNSFRALSRKQDPEGAQRHVLMQVQKPLAQRTLLDSTGLRRAVGDSQSGFLPPINRQAGHAQRLTVLDETGPEAGSTGRSRERAAGHDGQLQQRAPSSLPPLERSSSTSALGPIAAQAPVLRTGLEHYLSNPENRRRFEFVQQAMQHQDATGPEQGAHHLGMNLIRSQDAESVQVEHRNFFQDHLWMVNPAVSSVDTEDRFDPADVVLAQFSVASKADGCEGTLPKQLWFPLDQHDREVVAQHKGQCSLNDFLQHTKAGKTAEKLLQALGLGVSQVRSSPTQFVLEVTPRPGSDVASSGNILSGYLADPKHAQAHALLTNEAKFLIKHSGGFSYTLTNAPVPLNKFANFFSPKTWIMHSNFRSNQKQPYNANDVVMFQFAMASKRYGYSGQLPEKIVRQSISNLPTLAYFRDQGPQASLEGFLTKTPNGKHTQRVLDGLNMHAVGLEWDPRAQTAVVHVRPNAS